MCGIAGVFSDKKVEIGNLMTEMLLSLQHRGEDSAGIALYGALDLDEDEFLVELEIKEEDKLKEIESYLPSNLNKEVNSRKPIYFTRFKGSLRDVKELVYKINRFDFSKVLSAGKIYMMKDTGNVEHLSKLFDSRKKMGTHAIGHTRFSTESVVDRYHAHPFQSLVKSDTAVVHNGQITNYWNIREKLENKGHHFETNNDTECIVHFIADKLNEGIKFEKALKMSVDYMDGPFSYIISIPRGIGIAKDSLGLRPAVIGESEDVSAIASEEMAIRKVLGKEANIDYLGPGEVKTFVGR